MDDIGWLRLADAARVAGVSRATFDRIATAGRVPFATVAGQRFFRTDDVEALAGSLREGEPEHSSPAAIS